MTQIAEHEQSERDKVEGWRLHVLIEAGYPLPLAERLAHSEADLHAAVELVRQGLRAADRGRDPPLAPRRLPTRVGRGFHPPPACERIAEMRTRCDRKANNSHRPHDARLRARGAATQGVASGREGRGDRIRRPPSLHGVVVQPRHRRVARAPADGLGRGRGHRASSPGSLAERLPDAQGPRRTAPASP